MCNQTLREVVKGMCKGYPNGRAGMASALDMTENTFNNKLYGKNGCRFFELFELEEMERLSGTTLLLDYLEWRRNQMEIAKIKAEPLDKVDLFEIRMNLDAMYGSLYALMQKCVAAGFATEDKLIAMENAHGEIFSYSKGFLKSFNTVYRAEKP